MKNIFHQMGVQLFSFLWDIKKVMFLHQNDQKSTIQSVKFSFILKFFLSLILLHFTESVFGKEYLLLFNNFTFKFQQLFH